jgi:hypothetical protein
LQSTANFDLVIFATGFNREKIPAISPGGQITPFFWQNDDYANPNVSHAGKDFAIVGIGDGALQDFLRLVCDPMFLCASDIVDTIKGTRPIVSGSS